jgi:hypothetical protein
VVAVVTAFCCECKEDFPVAEIGSGIRMGVLFPLKRMPLRLQDRFHSWADDEDSEASGAYLCGNCYFDLTDA